MVANIFGTFKRSLRFGKERDKKSSVQIQKPEEPHKEIAHITQSSGNQEGERGAVSTPHDRIRIDFKQVPEGRLKVSLSSSIQEGRHAVSTPQVPEELKDIGQILNEIEKFIEENKNSYIQIIINEKNYIDRIDIVEKTMKIIRSVEHGEKFVEFLSTILNIEQLAKLDHILTGAILKRLQNEELKQKIEKKEKEIFKREILAETDFVETDKDDIFDEVINFRELEKEIHMEKIVEELKKNPEIKKILKKIEEKNSELRRHKLEEAPDIEKKELREKITKILKKLKPKEIADMEKIVKKLTEESDGEEIVKKLNDIKEILKKLQRDHKEGKCSEKNYKEKLKKIEDYIKLLTKSAEFQKFINTITEKSIYDSKTTSIFKQILREPASHILITTILQEKRENTELLANLIQLYPDLFDILSHNDPQLLETILNKHPDSIISSLKKVRRTLGCECGYQELFNPYERTLDIYSERLPICPLLKALANFYESPTEDSEEALILCMNTLYSTLNNDQDKDKEKKKDLIYLLNTPFFINGKLYSFLDVFENLEKNTSLSGNLGKSIKTLSEMIKIKNLPLIKGTQMIEEIKKYNGNNTSQFGSNSSLTEPSAKSSTTEPLIESSAPSEIRREPSLKKDDLVIHQESKHKELENSKVVIANILKKYCTKKDTQKIVQLHIENERITDAILETILFSNVLISLEDLKIIVQIIKEPKDIQNIVFNLVISKKFEELPNEKKSEYFNYVEGLFYENKDFIKFLEQQKQQSSEKMQEKDQQEIVNKLSTKTTQSETSQKQKRWSRFRQTLNRFRIEA